VEALVEFRRDQRTKQLVRFFARGVGWNPAEALGHAKHVGAHGECGEDTCKWELSLVQLGMRSKRNLKCAWCLGVHTGDLLDNVKALSFLRESPQ
jgi:hypothetical protein